MWDEVAKGAVEGLVRGILSRKKEAPGTHAFSAQVEAQSFVLRDDHGRGRAILSMLTEGPGLMLLDAQEAIKALFAIDKQGGHLQFWGRDKTTNVIVRIEENEPEMVFFDGKEEPRASIRLYASGPCYRLWDENGKCRVMLQMDTAEGPSVTIYDENEAPIHWLGQSDCGKRD